MSSSTDHGDSGLCDSRKGAWTAKVRASACHVKKNMRMRRNQCTTELNHILVRCRPAAANRRMGPYLRGLRNTGLNHGPPSQLGSRAGPRNRAACGEQPARKKPACQARLLWPVCLLTHGLRAQVVQPALPRRQADTLQRVGAGGHHKGDLADAYAIASNTAAQSRRGPHPRSMALPDFPPTRQPCPAAPSARHARSKLLPAPLCRLRRCTPTSGRRWQSC